MKKKLLLLTLLLTFSISNAQDFRFGKVGKEELQQTVHPIEKEANAAILYRSQDIKFVFSKEDGFTQENTIYQRVKIYNKEGYDWATQKVILYNKTSSLREKLVDLKGYTYTLDNGKINKTKLKKENIFKEETNKYWASNTFTMPGITEGCVLEFEYKIKSPYIQIDDVLLQYNVPLDKIKVEIATPEFFNFNKIVNPKANIYPDIKERKRNRKEKVTSSSRTQSGGWSSSQTNFKSSDFVFFENIISIDMESVPALKDEPFVDNLDNYRSKLALEYAFYKGPNGVVESYATTWDKVTYNIYKDEDFGGQLNITNYFEDDINALVSETTNDNEKIQLVFDYVKSKVKWNDFIGYTSENGVKNSYKDGVGNVGDINLMLIAMLRHVGLIANPVLVSTRDNSVPLFPTRSGFNYLICAIEDQGKLVLLDATQKYATANMLPIRAINWQGRLIRKDGTSTWVNLNPTVVSKEIILATVNLNEDLSAEGKVRKVLTNYQAYNYRNKNANKSSEALVLNTEKGNSGLIVTNLEVKNAKLSAKNISQSYEYVYENAAEKIGDNIYLSPLLFLSQEENPFTQDIRNYNIDFIYPISEKRTMGITIPDGYEVAVLPENAAVKFNNDAVSFSYLINHSGDTIQLTVNLDINKTIISTEDYQNFKEIFQLMAEKNAEKIVLKKL